MNSDISPEPRISIIMPAYNAVRHLGATLESVLAQTRGDWELVLVDDGSSDATSDLAAQYAARDGRIRVFSKANGGVATARNFGYERAAASSEYVIFLDHDDLWEPDALQTLAAALDADAPAVAAHGLARKVDRAGKPCPGGGASADGVLNRDRRKIVGNRVVKCSHTEPTTFAVLAYDGVMCTPGLVLIRRAALKGMTLFRQDLAPSDDGEFWVRLSLKGDFAFVDQVVLQWQQHETNASLQQRRLLEAMAEARCRVVTMPELTLAQRRLAHWRYRRMYASVVRHDAMDWRQWAVESMARGHWALAAGQLGRALGLLWRYLTLRWFWFGLTSRGPVPIRAKDDLMLRQRELTSS